MGIIAFGRNGTANPNAVIIINTSSYDRNVSIDVIGNSVDKFTGYRTSEEEKYCLIEEIAIHGGKLLYEAPGRSVTTFFENGSI